ncbi:hypothetical protein FCOL_11505 [Flavobacterium columnare ATCC 49512]|uniref:DUF3871 family protein n=1 Tax=Flavobacterium columnare (strain ATCC 49512 / CIP 103533 / TG 44/87) TaxID=1041826 RepID=G8X7Z0_FLACA|nr:DUF3871 family protein [Flavobacterium columnare]AEW87104.1 hypothetical protein FCOL_11505 [Flavobacterium columnare ATCC 49512]
MEAQVIIESKINQESHRLIPVKPANNIMNPGTFQTNNVITPGTTKFPNKPFIEANTQEISLHSLQNDCVIPVFSKDNERTISHQEFIEIAQEAVLKVFPHHTFENPEIRVSHQIKGRTPEAIHKNVKDLLDHERTQYFERMAFIIRIPSIVDKINGNEIALTIGGVRSYNLENLYNKKTFEKFKFFIGFQNKVCCNLCVWSDGFVDDMKVSSYQELQTKIAEVIQNYNAEKHLLGMKEFSKHSLTETQFAQLIGRTRLYQHLPKKDKVLIPNLNFTDGHINTIVKDYFEDDSFCRNEQGDINLWNVYNLFTQANKSSYIDTFLDRNVNAYDFTNGIQKALIGNGDYNWFLS